MNITYDVTEHIGKVAEYKNKTIEVNLISWNDGAVKIDIRKWNTENGAHEPCRGICLTTNEAHRLCDILNGIFTKTWKETKEESA